MGTEKVGAVFELKENAVESELPKLGADPKPLGLLSESDPNDGNDDCVLVVGAPNAEGPELDPKLPGELEPRPDPDEPNEKAPLVCCGALCPNTEPEA